MKLQVIHHRTAHQMINTRQAGFYATGRYTPIFHPDRYCVWIHATGCWYLLPSEEFYLVDFGISGNREAVPVQEFAVRIRNAHLQEMLYLDRRLSDMQLVPVSQWITS